MMDVPSPLPLELSPKDAVARLGDSNYIWIDVREHHEYAHGHMPNTHHLPLSQLTMGHFDQFDKTKTLIMICRSGNRSGMVTDTLRKMGIRNVQNLSGGLIGLNMELKEKVPVLMH